MNRLEFKQRVEAILTEVDDIEDQLTQIMAAHDRTVEDALEEYEQALNDTERPTRGRSSLNCPEDVDMHVVEAEVSE